ncbi:ribonuclease H-like domain-containing protein [Tanacetum coccineum]
MTGSDPLPTPLPEKLSLVTHHHLLTRVLIKLDLDIWNYSSWQYFFEQLCESYDALKFIYGPNNTSSSSTQAPPTPFTPDEMKVDKIILSWIFTTISDSLQKQLVIARPTSAKVAWDFIGDLVKENKRTRTSTLKTELRSITLGDLTMEAYFQKVESLMTILSSLDSPVSEDDVVHYVINGLPAKYNQVCGYMHYQETFPGFKTIRSLLLTEEMRLKTIPEDSSSSSPMVLLAESGLMDNTSQATLLPQAFTTGTLHDPATRNWNMDTDLGSLNYFLGISVTRDSFEIFLSQKKYALVILERARMVHCNSSRTPVDTESKLGDTGDVVSNLTLYRSLAGSLQYLTFTRPDISYAVQQLFSSSTTDLVAYSDADWAGCPTTWRSTSDYCISLGNKLLSWSSKCQPMISRSSAEAEYRRVANVVAETCWLRNLLRELYSPLSSTTLVYYGNVSAVYLSCNPVQHQRTKHIEIDIHFVRDLVTT